MAIKYEVNIFTTENNGSQKKVIAEVTMNGTYDRTTGVIIPKEVFGMSRLMDCWVMEQYDSIVHSVTPDTPLGQNAKIQIYTNGSGSEERELEFLLAVAAPLINTNQFLYHNITAGTFTVGETVTGGTSGATGTVVSASLDLYNNPYVEVSGVTGTFAAAEVITGGTSGKTATLADEAHLRYEVESYVQSPVSTAMATSGGPYSQIDEVRNRGPVCPKGEFRYWPGSAPPFSIIECAESDGITALALSGMNGELPDDEFGGFVQLENDDPVSDDTVILVLIGY